MATFSLSVCWPEAEAMAVLHCESSGRERVVSKSNAVGLFQIKTDDLYKTSVRSLRVIQYLFPEVRDSWSAAERLLHKPLGLTFPYASP